MDREGFRNRLKQYKQAREENPGLKYWEWKDIPKYDEGGKVIPTQEEYIAEQIAARKAAALEKSLSRTMPRVPQGIKTGERWNPVTKKVEDIHECGPSCAYTFSDNYGQNWMGSEDFKQNHANYGWKQVPWEQRQPGNAVLIVDDSGTAKHTMMYDSDNAQGQPLFNHSNGGHDESAIRKKAKYPHHNPYLTYEFVGTPADSTQWINDYKKIYGFAEGTDGVTGPPTYEQWDADMNQYNPTILDNASMYWSIEAAKKALHNEAMKLPGYAERWTEYYRSLPKNDPDINEFVDELWANENPNNVGLKNGKYYPHKSPEGGKPTIGPGFKLGSGQHKITEKQANRGMTKSRLDQEARRVAKGYFRDVDAAINSGQTTNPADTVSPQIKAGLADILHQTGSLKKWPKLINAVREGDLEKIQNEAIVTWRDNNGVLHEDKRRNELRNEKNWHYAEGGEVEPDPLEILERSRPKVAGIPINDKPLSGTDPLGEAYVNLVAGNATRKLIEKGITGFSRKQLYNNYLDGLKWGHSRRNAYRYADSPDADVAQGMWRWFINPSLKASNFMRAIEKIVED